MKQRTLDIMRIKAQARARELYEKHLMNMQGERGNYAEERSGTEGATTTEETTEETAFQEA
jgi:hypothetical protein